MSEQAFTLAVAQTGVTPGDRDANLEAMAAWTARAAAAGARLVVFAELATTGYGLGPALRDLAEPLDGPSRARLAEAARRHGTAICYGYAERDGEDAYNSAALLGPDGAVLANHRKTHLYGDYEREVFLAGDRAVSLARLDGLSVALLICYEVEFPEMVRRVALAGAELVAVPTATASYPNPSVFSRTVVASRATENNVFVAYANHCGTDGRFTYNGESIIAGPLTDVYAVADGTEALLVAHLDRARLAEGAARFPYCADRRPELYAEPGADA